MRGAVERNRSSDHAPARRDGGRGEPPQDGANAQHELLRGERLGEIIVGAEGESLDPIRLVLARREQQNPDIARLITPPQLGENLEAGVPRQHQVQHDEVGTLFARGAQRVGAGAGGRDAIAFFRQMIRDERRDVRLVVHYEDAMHRTGVGRHKQGGR